MSTLAAVLALAACGSSKPDEKAPQEQTEEKPPQQVFDLSYLADTSYGPNGVEKAFLTLAETDGDKLLEYSDYQQADLATLSALPNYKENSDIKHVMTWSYASLGQQILNRVYSRPASQQALWRDFDLICQDKLPLHKITGLAEDLSHLIQQDYFKELEKQDRLLTVKTLFYLARAEHLSSQHKDPIILQTSHRLTGVRQQIVDGTIRMRKINTESISGQFHRDTNGQGFSLFDLNFQLDSYDPAAMNTIVHESIHAAQFTEGGSSYNISTYREREGYIHSRIYSLAQDGDAFRTAHQANFNKKSKIARHNIARSDRNIKGYSKRLDDPIARIQLMFFYMVYDFGKNLMDNDPHHTAMAAANAYLAGDQERYNSLYEQFVNDYPRMRNSDIFTKLEGNAEKRWTHHIQPTKSQWTSKDFDTVFEREKQRCHKLAETVKSEAGSNYHRANMEYHIWEIFRLAALNKMQEAVQYYETNLKPYQADYGDLRMYNKN